MSFNSIDKNIPSIKADNIKTLYKSVLYGLLVGFFLYGGHLLVSFYFNYHVIHEYLENWEYAFLVVMNSVFIFYFLIQKEQNEKAWLKVSGISRDYYYRYFEAAPIAYLSLDQDGYVVDVNKAWEDLTGYSRDEYSHVSMGGLAGNELASMFKNVVLGNNKNDGETIELKLIKKDGAEVEVRVEKYFSNQSLQGFPEEAGLYEYCALFDVTKENKANRSLYNNREEFELLLGALEEGVWSANCDGSQYYYLNDSVGIIYGRPIHEFYEKRKIWLDAVHPDDYAEVKKISEKLFESGFSSSEYRIIRPDGNVRWILDRKSTILNSEGNVEKIGGVVTDITARKKSESMILKERERADIYLDLVDVIIVMLDTEAKIRLLNRRGYEILGYEYGSLIGKNWFELFLPESAQEQVSQVFSGIIKGEIQFNESYENEVLTKDGELRLIAWHNTILYDDDENILGLLSSGMDVTEEKKSTIERERLNMELTQAQKVDAVGRLTGGIVHDFNNILASILGYTGLAIERYSENIPEKLASYLKEVQVAGERARDLVDQLLRFSSASHKFDPQRLKLASLVQEVSKMLEAPMTSQIQIDLNLDEAVPDVFVDSVQAHQAIVNLCVNARDAMNGYGQIQISLKKIYLKSLLCAICDKTLDGEWVELKVTDFGCGIKPENLDKIFDSFFTTKEKGKGTGIGLSVTSSIMKQHGGHIFVNSEYGEGSSFHLLFPIMREENDDSENKLFRKYSRNIPYGASGRVLVVDDEHSLTTYLDELLTYYGYKVHTMHDSVEALEHFQACPDAYDLVISDHVMHEMNGSELLVEMLSIKPELSVILYSGYLESIDKERAQAFGIQCFIAKPFDPNEFMHTVWMLISNNKDLLDS